MMHFKRDGPDGPSAPICSGRTVDSDSTTIAEAPTRDVLGGDCRCGRGPTIGTCEATATRLWFRAFHQQPAAYHLQHATDWACVDCVADITLDVANGVIQERMREMGRERAEQMTALMRRNDMRRADGLPIIPSIQGRTVDSDSEKLRDEVTRLREEVEHLRDKLAEETAMQNPRLRCLLIKAAPDRDLYVGWSGVCDAPTGAWTRAEAIAYGFPPSKLDHADQNGSSSHHGDGAWDDSGFVAEQRGWLTRDRLGDYALAWLDGRTDDAFDLLEPLDGESEVRR
jgi:hypothetical protein